MVPNSNRLSPSATDRGKPAAAWRHPGPGEGVKNPFLTLVPGTISPQIHLELPTTLLDRFFLRKPLGRGSVGQVYLADDALRGQPVALKIVLVRSHDTESLARMILQETNLQARIQDYRHVIRVFDVHRQPWGGGMLLLLAMEYAEGGTFCQWLENCRTDLGKRRTEGLLLFQQICLGVSAIHAVCERHGDIKPSNLLLVKGQIKVSDFGCSRSLRTLSTGPEFAGPEPWSSGGTVAYMGPEQRGMTFSSPVGFGSDIYALGMVLLEILFPEYHATFVESLASVGALSTPALASIPSATGIDPRSRQVMERCLRKDPAQRYVCIEDLLADLDGTGNNQAVSTTNSGPTVEHLWKQCRVGLQKGHLMKAMKRCQQILELDSTFAEAQTLFESLRTRYDQAERHYQAIERDLDRQSLQQLTQLLQQARSIFSNHPTGLLIEARVAGRAREFRENMKKGVHALSGQAWEMAHRHFQEAVRLNPGAPGAVQALNFTARVQEDVTDLRRQIDQAVRDRHQRQALSLARSLDDYLKKTIQQIDSLSRNFQ